MEKKKYESKYMEKKARRRTKKKEKREKTWKKGKKKNEPLENRKVEIGESKIKGKKRDK